MPVSHDEFILNLDGGSKGEVLLLQLVMPVGILLYGSLSVLLQVNFSSKSNYWPRIFLENLVFAIPYQLLVTVFSDYLVAAITTSCVLSAAILLTVSRRRDGQNVGTSVVEGRSPFTTWVRSWLYMATAVCILAVDFPAFPRRYAKCENFGVSLMDTGVGWYVVVHAMSLNNATTRDETSAKKKGEEEATRTRGFLRWVRQTLPLLILGLVRLITVKSVEYPEHVSEYGVHFNFFFTLFFLKIYASLVQMVPSRQFSVALLLSGCTALTISESLMQRADSRAYLFDAERTTLISANREGLFSLLGYGAIFSFSTLLTRKLLVPFWQSKATDWRAKCRLLVKLLLASVFFYATLRLCEGCFDPVSRRFANSSFVFWTLALSTFMLAMFLSVEILLSKCPSGWPLLLEAIGRQGLLHFLAANLLTGLVNLSLNAHETRDGLLSSAILSAYMVVTNTLAAVAYRRANMLS